MNGPICIGCAKHPHEIDSYRFAMMEGPDDPEPTNDEIRDYVIAEEGTFNRSNGHFLCDDCYIKAGMPSSPGGWVAP